MARRSVFDRLWAFGHLDLSDTQVGTVKSFNVMTGLLMRNSTIVGMHDMSFGNSAKLEEDCFLMMDSEVHEIKGFVSFCDSLFENSKIREINSTSLLSSRFINTTIHKVETGGIMFHQGFHRLQSVTFENLEIRSLKLDYDADVYLEDISIGNCDKPCVLVAGGYVTATNISVGGVVVKDFLNSEYVELKPVDNGREVRTDSHSCKATMDVIYCDFVDLTDAVSFNLYHCFSIIRNIIRL